MYMLSAPELYIWHGTIRFIAPNLRGYDMLNPESELPVRENCASITDSDSAAKSL